MAMQEFPSSADAYNLCHPIGKGATADVWFAVCIPLNLPVAIKIIDLDSCPSSLDEIRVSLIQPIEKKSFYKY